MIDDAVMMDYIRDANPVPNLDDLDPGELTRSAAATETRRAAAMRTPTQHPTEIQPTPPRRRLATWAFAVAFIVVLVGVGIAALVLRSGDVPVSDEPVTETTMAEKPTETAVVETPTETTLAETPTEPTQLESLTWSRIPHDETVFGPKGRSRIQGVTAADPGFVAVGEDWIGAAVWTSPDGYSWSRVPVDPELSGPRGNVQREMRNVTPGGPGFVAVGTQHTVWLHDVEPLIETVERTALVWTSPDGAAWTLVPHDAVFDGGDMHSVTAGGPGLVAVGSVGNTAAMWTSRDGATWVRANVSTNQADGLRHQSVVTDVTVGGPGLVAVGRNTSSAAVWTSPDGNTWTPTLQDETVFGGEGIQAMSSVTVGGPGLVAVGDDHGRAAVWTSPDGYAWTRIPHDEATFGVEINPAYAPTSPDDYYDDEHSMRDVVATDAGLVAVGRDTNLPQAVVWTSTDGISWSRVPYGESIFGRGDQEGVHEDPSAGMEMNSVAADGSRLVAVGGDRLARIGAAWVAEP